MKNIEIGIFIANMIVILILFLLIRRVKEKYKRVYFCSIVIIILIEMFIGIHFLFCYQIGFPASVTQQNNSDLNLTSADWLNFLGGYLGFAGSLVMAYLVYRQSEAINDITMLEYKPSVTLLIERCAKSTDFGDNKKFTINAIIQNIPDSNADEYYSYHCAYKKSKNEITDFEDFQILLFVNIVNTSKSLIDNLSFKSLKIEELIGERNFLEYVNRGDQFDPADGYTDILPNRCLKRCFLIEQIPKTINTSWMTLRFTYGKDNAFDLRVLVSKTEGNSLILLNSSEQIK